MQRLLSFILLSIILRGHETIADGNDWINPTFVLQKSGAPDAQQKIIQYAKSSGSKGPWTVYGTDTVLPPNGDKLDYFSWAPYHWPNCNWCAGARSHLATGGNRTEGDSTDGTQGGTNSTSDEPDSSESPGSPELPTGGLPVSEPSLPTASLPISHRKMIRRLRRSHNLESLPGPDKRELAVAPGNKLQLSEDDVPNLGSIAPSVGGIPTALTGTQTTSEDDGTFGGGSASAAQEARKTQKPDANAKTQKAPPTKATPTAANCTPSPAKSLPPSATWTTCPYVVKDGQINPDVRLLQGVSTIVDVTQSVLYNALSSVLSSNSNSAQMASSFLQTYFLSSSTGMHPRVQYGQVIRGPGTQVGQFLGVLDLRGMVKVANAVAIMRAEKTPSWPSSVDAQLVSWVSQYAKWMQSSDIGQKALSAPNNHGTFAASQLSGLSLLMQDPSAAKAALNNYFLHQFQDQIAASGEQPFEAVRTRPFHYRCFNLEAMITNAKIGDQLGLDFWTAKSKYGATIKDALDFVFHLGPGKEDVSDIFPHIAAIAAAYGDPAGAYMAYLQKMDKNFMAAPYYYYNQPAAFTLAPNSAKGKGKNVINTLSSKEKTLEVPSISMVPSSTSAPIATPTIPWECPEAFETATEVELDDGVYITCDDLKHFYGYAVDDDDGTDSGEDDMDSNGDGTDNGDGST